MVRVKGGLRGGAGYSLGSREKPLRPTVAGGLGSLCHVCRPGRAGRRSAGPATRARAGGCVRVSGDRGRSEAGMNPRCPECLRCPEPPHPAADRPAHLGLARVQSPPRGSPPRPALTCVRASACAELHTRVGVGARFGGPARGSGLRWTRKTRGACVPRQDGLRAAPLPRRRHAPTRPSAGLHRAAPHPPHPELAWWLRCPRRSVPTPSQRDSDQSFPRS